MSSSSNDPNAPDPKPEMDSAEPPPAEKATKASTVGRQAALLAAALAAANAAPAAAAPDRAYLEALLHGSWTQPPDLTARRLPAGTEADVARLAGDPDIVEQGFNDSFNPKPTPYTDKIYIDTGFNDSTR